MEIGEIFKLMIVKIGLVANLIFDIILSKHPLKSKVTTFILIFQSALDLLVCLASILQIVLPSYDTTGNYVLDLLICHIWTSQVVYWLPLCVSIHNLIIIAVDRYRAVVYATTYRKHQKLMITTGVVYAVTMGFLCSFPVTLETRLLEDGTCVPENAFNGTALEEFIQAYAILWFVFTYSGPTVFFVIIYSRILRTIKSTVSTTNRSSSTTNSVRKLTKAAMVVTLAFITLLCYDPFYYLIARFGLVTYVYNTPMQQVGVFMSSLNSCVNPFIFFLIMQEFRQQFVAMFVAPLLGFCLKTVKVKDQMVRSSTNITG